jgi:hypothetical protein
MNSVLVFLLALGAICVATNEQRIPLELLNRDKILARGGWGLSISTCPVRASGCNIIYCPNSSICASSLLGSWASQACCSDSRSYYIFINTLTERKPLFFCNIILTATNVAADDYSTLPVTSFCENHMWPTWWLPGETDLGYFTCLEGQIGPTSVDFVSNLKRIAAFLKAFFVSRSFLALVR